MNHSPQDNLGPTQLNPLGAQISWLRVCASVAFLVCVAYASTVRLGGDDFWLQAKIGEYIVNSHSIPQTLLYPFTEIASERFNAHEWFMSVLFHLSLSAFGEDGMPFVVGAMGLVLFGAMARLSYVRSGGSYSIALLGGYVSLLVENYRHVLRPELPSLIFMALLLNILEGFKKKASWVLALWSALIMVAWSNSHGSFILGPLMVGMFATGLYLDDLVHSKFQQRTPSPLVVRSAGLLLLTCASCLVNPFGWELIQFVFSFSTSSGTSKHLTEWLPTFDARIWGVRGFWIALAVWILTFASVMFGRKRLSAVDWLMFVAFTYLAYRAIRFPVYLGMLAAYIVPTCLPPQWRQKSREPLLLKFGIAVAAATVGAVALFGNAAESRLYSLQDRTKLTIPMVQVLSDPALQGNVLNSMEYGAELIYRAYPRLRPSIDCRFDSYGVDYSLFNDALFRDDALLNEFVARYDVRYLLVSADLFERFQALQNWKQEKWRIYFADQRSVLLQRADVRQGRTAK